MPVEERIKAIIGSIGHLGIDTAVGLIIDAAEANFIRQYAAERLLKQEDRESFE